MWDLFAQRSYPRPEMTENSVTLRKLNFANQGVRYWYLTNAKLTLQHEREESESMPDFSCCKTEKMEEQLQQTCFFKI